MTKNLFLLLFSLYSSVNLCNAQLWEFDNLTITTKQHNLIIRADSIKSPLLTKKVTEIIYSCKSAQVYPIHQCNSGQIYFNYDTKTYNFTLKGYFDFAKTLWDFDISNANQSIALNNNSQLKDFLKITIKKAPLSQLALLLLPEYTLPEETKNALITAEFNIDFTHNLKLDAQYLIENLSWESQDGNYIISESSLTGNIIANESPSSINLQVTTNITNGEGLFKDIYIAFKETPLSINSSLLFDKHYNPIKTQISLNSSDSINFNIELLDWSTSNFLIQYDISDLTKFYNGFLASYMDILGIQDLETVGKSSGVIQFNNNLIESIDSKFEQFYLVIDSKKVEINNLFANIKWNNSGNYQESQFNWESLLLAGMPISQSNLIVNAVGDRLKLAEHTSLPIFDGYLSINTLDLKDLFKPDISINFDGEVKPISLALITEKMDWQSMNGTISGKIPGMKKSGQTITFDGALKLNVFGGKMLIDNLSIERLFGIAPVVAADINFENLNLKQITSTFDFGEINGLINGYVKKLRITNWKADRLDAYIKSIKSKEIKQTISQRAIDNISSIGGIQGALSRSFLRFFDDFKYKNIAIGCRLRNSICEMSGIQGNKKLNNNTYKLIEGKGIPSINIIGFRKFIDWEIFIDRLLNAGY